MVDMDDMKNDLDDFVKSYTYHRETKDGALFLDTIFLYFKKHNIKRLEIDVKSEKSSPQLPSEYNYWNQYDSEHLSRIFESNGIDIKAISKILLELSLDTNDKFIDHYFENHPYYAVNYSCKITISMQSQKNYIGYFEDKWRLISPYLFNYSKN